MSPFFVNATMEGVVRAPSELEMTTDSPASQDGHAGVGGAEVDADDFTHVLYW